MTLIFADTSYFVAAISPRDAHHDRANALMHDYSGNVVTTDFVIVEVGNYLRRLTDRSSFAPICSSIRNDPQFEVVEASRHLLDRGIQLFVNRPDKKWSLTDCISFVVMQDYSVTDALTGDEHFEQAGFKALLRF